MHINIYKCMYTCMYIYIYVYIYMYMYITIHIYMYVYIHIYTEVDLFQGRLQKVLGLTYEGVPIHSKTNEWVNSHTFTYEEVMSSRGLGVLRFLDIPLRVRRVCTRECSSKKMPEILEHWLLRTFKTDFWELKTDFWECRLRGVDRPRVVSRAFRVGVVRWHNRYAPGRPQTPPGGTPDPPH